MLFIRYFSNSITVKKMNTKRDRERFMCKLCDYVNADTNKQTSDIRPIAEGWGISKEEVDHFIAYYKEKNYIRTAGFGDFHYRLSITADGIDYVISVDCSAVKP